MIALLFLPAFVSAQYGIKKCHTDLVFGYDYGDRINFDKDGFEDRSVSSLQTFRIGANVRYPISQSQRWFLVTGFRVAGRLSHEDFFIIGTKPQTPPAKHYQITSQDVFAELPFRSRFVLKNINRENRLFLEGGIQFNIYVFSHWKEEYSEQFGGEIEDERIERTNNFQDMFLTSNLSFGWETEIRNGPEFFIQAIGRLELMPADNYDANAIHVGIETGFRF